MSEINWDEVSPDECVYDGVVYLDHDYDEYECRRCGAEAPFEDDNEPDTNGPNWGVK